MNSMSTVSDHSLLAKTKMCRFAAGGCSLGNSCRFAHDVSELKSPPDLSKTKLCKSFGATGSCDAVQCKYAHGKHELRKLSVNRGRNFKNMVVPSNLEKVNTVACRQGDDPGDTVGQSILQALANTDIPAKVVFSV
uniref:C3H1-type domain-containing protein n=1 Tax=Noctiluca scintillans TaxID=2966 RepID=A0A7S1FKS9_NOCSC|mmetsp:Transcript_9416/g.26222  ORF Transcript_9416/g.26222 Transcript_9416/m.26222 type:complete len:136 (+) Transcript_9416:75-482(+)